MNATPFHQELLKRHLAERCERNSRYSVRAFARALRVDVAALSRILAGKQVPSFKIAQKVFDQLELTPVEQQEFLASIAQAQRERGLQRVSPELLKTARKAPRTLDIDFYRVIADWYHGAILELTRTDDFRSDPRWIASQLGIQPAEAKLAIERLVDLELLRREDGRLVREPGEMTTADKNLTTPALRKNQKQLLEKAVASLENDPIEERSMTSMLMAGDPRKIGQAKEMIEEFNRKLSAFLGSGRRTRVFNVSIALYPVQKQGEDK